MHRTRGITMKHQLSTIAATAAVLAMTLLSTACGHDLDHAVDATAPHSTALSLAAAHDVLLTPADMSTGWAPNPTPAPDNSLSAADVSIDPAACKTATETMETTAQRWDAASVHDQVAYQADTSGQAVLKEEVFSDAAMDPSGLLDTIRTFLDACSTYHLDAGTSQYDGATSRRDYGQHTNEIGFLQTWTSPTTPTVQIRFAYLVRGATITVLTLSSTQAPEITDHDFTTLVAAAASKLDHAVGSTT